MLLFPYRLKWLREKHGFSQKEMAEKLEISQPYYNKFEKGTGQPNLETLWRIRHVLGEPIDFIIGYHFEDIRAELLYELYAEARRLREETEEDMEYATTSRDPNQDMEKHIKLVRHYREKILDYMNKEEKAFTAFFDHISTIPGFDGEFANKDYWIDRYASYQENDKKLHHEFWEEFHNIK